MPDQKEPRRFAEIQNVSKKECYEKWKGVRWVADEETPDVGVCDSDFDFDGWAAEYEEKNNES